MSPIEISSTLIALLSLVTTLVANSKKNSNVQIDNHMSVRLGLFKDALLEDLKTNFVDPNGLNQFKDALLKELKECFVDTKVLDLQFQLRETEIKSLSEKLKGLDHRTTRNTQHISMLLDIGMKTKRLMEDPRFKDLVDL